MTQHRTNRPVTAQLEVHYSKRENSDRNKIVGTLLRVQQHSDGSGDADSPEKSSADDSRHSPSLQTDISSNMKVCDLYQCVHSHHYHHHGDWAVHVPECARRFSESNLGGIGSHFHQMHEGKKAHNEECYSRPMSENEMSNLTFRHGSRRTVSCSSAGLEFDSDALPALNESESSLFQGQNPFRKHYTLDTSVPKATETDPIANTNTNTNTNTTAAAGHNEENSVVSESGGFDADEHYDYNDDYDSHSPTASRVILNSRLDSSADSPANSPADSLHACKIEVPSSCTATDDSSLCSLDLSSPCSNHHHRRNSLAVKFKKPQFKSV
ncbi:unnamed protein product [Kluyveromyces dobzhanskii CBS 2104]|uniref:WGS project CCBQ000000000 data, contig 00015 n=1 Tax=Kluyveromyces dobzhanskii CBS 2104 TaxID=1427455 RepID=A0A0A8LBW9_9SACH|nr:unnamed protein product [Kluyveromyces dobzhanskii CBS 2104]